MSKVEVELYIDATPQEVWDVALDPSRLNEWVTIHKKLDRAPNGALKKGDKIAQTLVLRGVPFKVNWKVESLTKPRSAVWKGKGPAHSTAITEYNLQAKGDGTLFKYSNEFIAPGGPLGRIAAGALVGGIPEVEAQNSLTRLKKLLEANS